MAIIIWGILSNSFNWEVKSSPPIIEHIRKLNPVENNFNFSSTCNTNSLVGSNIIEYKPKGFLLNSLKIGRQNEAVFPVPVFDIAITFLSFNIWGITYFWTSVGSLYDK